jgi:DNA-directed RNA polymerase specialized sigma24 family protein
MNEHDVAVLYGAYGYAVFRRCLVYLRDTDAAWAAMQRTFLRALRNVSSFQAVSDPQVWLCRAADELCVSILEHQVRDGLPKPEPSLRQLGACVAHDDHEHLLKVWPLLRALAPREMRFAVLFYVDELTEDELARELGLSRRAVARRVSELVRNGRVQGAESQPC